MSLRELTKESHAAAENTKFMKSVFAKKIPQDIWADWTLQKAYFYKAIEDRCRTAGLLENLTGIERYEHLMEDCNEMMGSSGFKDVRKTTKEYVNYIDNLDLNLVAAHLYTWHMGDMFGGQMIRRIVNAPHRNLAFENAEQLKVALRLKLDDSLAEEANKAFAWAIKLMSEYDSSLG